MISSKPKSPALTAFLALCCCSLLLIGPRYAVAEPRGGDYSENPVLSDLLEKEGFIFGITGEDASSAYGLSDSDPGSPHVLTNKWLMESFSRGFYVGVVDEASNMLVELAKCLRIEEGLVNERDKIDEFKEQFGLKDENGCVITLKGIDSDTLPLLHTGRKLHVTLTPMRIEGVSKTAIILGVIDTTNEMLDCY